MPLPSFIATVVLAAVVLVLAIARIRSQRRLSNAAKSVQSGPTADVPHIAAIRRNWRLSPSHPTATDSSGALRSVDRRLDSRFRGNDVWTAQQGEKYVRQPRTARPHHRPL